MLLLCVCVCFMQRLLQHPELSNSQLLADFLSPYSMESQFLDRMLPDVNLGMFTSYISSLSEACHVKVKVWILLYVTSCW